MDPCLVGGRTALSITRAVVASYRSRPSGSYHPDLERTLRSRFRGSPAWIWCPSPTRSSRRPATSAHKILYGGLADLRPMPRTLIDEGELREVYHYRPAATAREQGDPVLLVTPLAAPALCFDLRRGCSLVEHFVGRRAADVPRGVRRGLVPQPQPRHGALDRRGGADRDRARSPRTPAGGRCTWSAGASAASSRCSPPPTARTCRSPR